MRRAVPISSTYSDLAYLMPNTRFSILALISAVVMPVAHFLLLIFALCLQKRPKTEAALQAYCSKLGSFAEGPGNKKGRLFIGLYKDGAQERT